MPVSLSDLQTNNRTITVDYDTDKVTLVYKPGIITPSTTAGFTRKGMVAQLEQLLVSWDVLDDKGKALPVTKELLEAMPARFLTHIVNGINEDLRPNATRAAN